MICKMCGKDKPDTELRKTPAQILHGGTPVQKEYRCTTCDVGVWRVIEKTLDGVRPH